MKDLPIVDFMKDLPIVDFIVNEEPFEDCPEDVQIYRDDLDAEFQVQAERRLKWGDVEAWSRERVTTLKNQLGVMAALIGAKERDNMTNAGIKITERKVEECVITNPDYKAKQAELAAAQRQLDHATTRRISMDHRRDMLVGMGANYRAEGNADPVIFREENRRKLMDRDQLRKDHDAEKKAAQEAAAAAAQKQRKQPPGKRPPGRRPPGKRPPTTTA
jgi:hypothetical protein